MLPVTRQLSHPAVVSGEEAQTGAGNTADGMGSAGHASSAVALWHAQVAVLAEERHGGGVPTLPTQGSDTEVRRAAKESARAWSGG